MTLKECEGETVSEDEVDAVKEKFADCDDKRADSVLNAVALRETVTLTDCEVDTEAVVDEDSDTPVVTDCETDPL